MTTSVVEVLTNGPWEVVPLSGLGGPYAIRMPTPSGAKQPTYYGVQSVARKADARAIVAVHELIAALQSCGEFLDGQVDVVDGSYGEPEPNRAMILIEEVRAALAKAGA